METGGEPEEKNSLPELSVDSMAIPGMSPLFRKTAKAPLLFIFLNASSSDRSPYSRANARTGHGEPREAITSMVGTRFRERTFPCLLIFPGTAASGL